MIRGAMVFASRLRCALLFGIVALAACGSRSDEARETHGLTGAEATKYKYTGKEQDATGVYYYGARYYDPNVRRFMAADSELPNIYDPQQLNRYAYARNNPVHLVDPDGHSIQLAVGAALTATGYALQIATEHTTEIRQIGSYFDHSVGQGAGNIFNDAADALDENHDTAMLVAGMLQGAGQTILFGGGGGLSLGNGLTTLAKAARGGNVLKSFVRSNQFASATKLINGEKTAVPIVPKLFGGQRANALASVGINGAAQAGYNAGTSLAMGRSDRAVGTGILGAFGGGGGALVYARSVNQAGQLVPMLSGLNGLQIYSAGMYALGGSTATAREWMPAAKSLVNSTKTDQGH